MKALRILHLSRSHWWVALLGFGAVATSVGAAETNAPPAAVPEWTPQQLFEGGTTLYNNWLDLAVGGFLTMGKSSTSTAAASNLQWGLWRHRRFACSGRGRQGTTFTVDGRSIFDNHDYDLSLGLAKEKLGYLRFSFSEFRTWYNGDGGFYAPTGNWTIPAPRTRSVWIAVRSRSRVA